MVNAALKYEPEEIKVTKNPIFLPTPITYGSVGIAQMISNNHRFDASAYNIEAMNALRKIIHNKHGYIYLWSKNGLISTAYYGPRVKREYLPNTDHSIGFIGSAEMLEINPKPIKFVSTSYRETYGVQNGDVLLSRSGTIGNVTFVGKTLEKYCVSEHAIRIRCFKYGGYVYAFLATNTGRSIIQSFTFGAVVDQIEPEHLSRVPIPNAPDNIKQEIHNLIIDSFDLRDQSNDLIDKAQKLLYQELQLPDINEICPKYYSQNAGFRNFVVNVGSLNNRFDVSFHLPYVKDILEAISKNAEEITTLGDNRISSAIILPGRFKRIYVDKDHGVPFFGGKQLLSLNPSNVKYLSIAHHSERIANQLTLEENMCAVTCSGTIGKVMIVPKHWEGWALNQHVMRIKPVSKDIAGYIYAWLDSPYCHPLIVRNTYGAVVDEIDDIQLSNVAIPILKNKNIQKTINDCVLQANEMRYQAYLKEQDAINKMNEILTSN